MDGNQLKLTDEDIYIAGYGGWVRVKRHVSGEYYNHKYGYGGDSQYGYDSVVPFATLSSWASEGTMFQATTASISRSTNLPTVNSYYLPFNDQDGTARSQIRLGEGTYGFSGELSFELTLGTLKEFINDDFLERESFFDVSFHDGRNICSVTNCVWSSLGISCAPGGAVSMSISYQSNNGYMDRLQIAAAEPDDAIEYDENDLLVPYWTCGHDNFEQFDLQFERSVTPVFLNNDFRTAAYLRPGLVGINLNATSIDFIDDWPEKISIAIGAGMEDEHSIILDKSVLMSCQYNMSSMSDVGPKTYSWQSVSTRAKDRIFEINP